MRFSPTGRACALAFITAFTTLFTQVLVHRMVSAKLLNNFAFLVISLTMLGFALSGVVLSRWLNPLLAALEDTVVTGAALFALSSLVACYIFYRADVGVLAVVWRPDFVRAFLRCVPLALLYALPFTFCGLILGALLSSPSLPTARVYFFDLIRSALGALMVIPAIARLGVEVSLLTGGTVLLGATVLLTPPRRWLPRALALLAGVALLGSAVMRDRVFQMRYPAGSPLATATAEGRLEEVVWDPVSRIEMMRITPPDPETMVFPVLIGENRTFLARFVRMLSQNNNAPTYAISYDGNPESLRGIEETIYSAAYHATSVVAPRVVVIGVGGGFDVLNALFFGAAEVTGVEVNGATVAILTQSHRDYFKWVGDPRVRVVHGEGRNFLATTDRRFDVIQVSGVDSFSGTPAAAHVFSESYIYTAEAFDLYLSRLSEDGILNMMRYEYIPPHEMLRALTTAVAALRRAGKGRPSDHIVMVAATNHHFTALLLKEKPFTGAELQRLRNWVAGSPLMEVAAGPRLNAPGANMYQVFLDLEDPRREASFVAAYPFDISPAEDNRPFFFRRSFWWHLFPSDPMVWAATPAMEYGLILLLGIVGLASLLCVYLPLRWLTRGGEGTGPARYGIFFAGAGLGYLGVEIALLQKFGLFLGHPNHALSVVLAALLFSTGLGALFSAATVRLLGNLRFVSYLLSAAVLAEYGLVLPRLSGLFGLSLALRAAVVFVLVMPIGFCLGAFLPRGLEQLKADAPSFVPWAWGVNGIFSVLSPVLAVAVSMTWGINALLLGTIPVYLLVGFLLPGAREEVGRVPGGLKAGAAAIAGGAGPGAP